MVFSYPTRPARAVLQGLNISVALGCYIALVGSSGSWETTILSLIAQYYDPDAGKILVDDQPLKLLYGQQYRKSLASVGQEPVLYQASIRDNLLLGMVRDGPPIGDEELDAACKDANVYDFIQSLDSGLATEIGTRGVLMSGGQKQRIAIARALVRSLRILILDGATSTMSSASEQLVKDALLKAARENHYYCRPSPQ